MRTPGSRVPFALRLAVRLLPGEVREEVLGDLIEHWNLHVAKRPWVARVVWAWRQPLSTLASRLRFSRRANEHGSMFGRRADEPGSNFGGLSDVRCNIARGRNMGAGVSWLDFRLGFRMLTKYPGLTVVAGLALAFAIALGAGSHELVRDLVYPELPLDEGDRIVEIRNQDISTGSVDPSSLHDFVAWRDELRSVQEIGGYRTFRRNLITERGPATPVLGADMTAAAFGVARVPPLLGRSLLAADEMPGAPSVLLIGFDAWQSLFGGDPDVVGQAVRLGSEPSTIIGVMPAGFGWPWSHDLWAPLRPDVLDLEPGKGPAIQVVARLAPGATLEEAQAELAAVGQRMAGDHPETHEYLRPELVRYGRLPLPLSGSGWASAYARNVLMFAGIMLLVCANVALLLFARTAARVPEIAVRSALGASRSRIVVQLVVEALVLGGVAAALGLLAAEVGLGWVIRVLSQAAEGLSIVQEGLFGFWVDGRLSGRTVSYALMLTVVAAVVAAVVPALRVTGRGVQPHLQRAGIGGSGLDFGRFWTSVIVTQIAATVAFVPLAIAVGIGTAQIRSTEYGFPAEQYLSVELSMDREFYSLSNRVRDEPRHRFDARYEASVTELKRRLANEARVAAATVTGQIPGAIHTRRWFEVEGADAPLRTAGRHRAQTAAVDLDFFEALGVSVLSGRGFDPADLDSGHGVVIVNEDFVRAVLEDRNAIGRRLAFVDASLEDRGSPDSLGPWYEIVGVVEQIAMSPPSPDLANAAGIYRLLGPTEAYPVHMAVHVGPDPGSFAARAQELATEVDPTLQLHQGRPLDESAWAVELLYGSWFRSLLASGGIALLLSTAGIFSVMSFTVSRRTREIGVRVALGADRPRVVTAIFSRALRQVGLGVTAGGVLLLFLLSLLVLSDVEYQPAPEHAAVLALYLAAMLCVCLLACIVPMKRALAVEPTEALGVDG